MDGELEPHEHNPLDLANKEIRIVHVLPDEANTRIRCLFDLLVNSNRVGGASRGLRENQRSHNDVFDPSSYNALSYEWGPADVQHEIEVDGQSFYIRDNLWQFLQVYRESLRRLTQGKGNAAQRKLAARPLWVDALSIDQTNLDERNHQVQQMGMIYRNATYVICWLGSAKEAGFDFNVFNVDRQNLINLDQSQGGQRYLSSLGEQYLRAVHKLCKQSYWTRLWIVPEVLNARECLLCLSNDTMDLRYLHHIWDVIYEISSVKKGEMITETYQQIRGSLLTCFLDLRARQRHDGTTSYSLRYLLHQFGINECEDVRDRIFGLNALAESQTHLQVDYAISSDILFWQVITQCDRYEPRNLDNGSTMTVELAWNILKVLEQSLDSIQELFESQRVPKLWLKDFRCQATEYALWQSLEIGNVFQAYNNGQSTEERSNVPPASITRSIEPTSDFCIMVPVSRPKAWFLAHTKQGQSTPELLGKIVAFNKDRKLHYAPVQRLSMTGYGCPFEYSCSSSINQGSSLGVYRNYYCKISEKPFIDIVEAMRAAPPDTRSSKTARPRHESMWFT